MKTTSALILACAGSAAAFAPQASNKVRHTDREKFFRKKKKENGIRDRSVGWLGSVEQAAT